MNQTKNNKYHVWVGVFEFSRKVFVATTKVSYFFVLLVFQVAAQNCRKRKIDLISQLEEEVSRARQQKQNLIAEREELYRLRNEWTTKLHNLESAVLTGLNRNVRDYTFDYTGTSVKVTNRLAKAKA